MKKSINFVSKPLFYKYEPIPKININMKDFICTTEVITSLIKGINEFYNDIIKLEDDIKNSEEYAYVLYASFNEEVLSNNVEDEEGYYHLDLSNIDKSKCLIIKYRVYDMEYDENHKVIDLQYDMIDMILLDINR